MASRPFILLTNDDGMGAPGLEVLTSVAKTFADVAVVAPAHNRSGASHSITLTQPMRLKKMGDLEFSLDGTPVDCVLMALRELLPKKPDWVVSGINRGPNLGDDTLYSGTVGAALSGLIHDVPGMAISLAGFHEPMYYDTAGALVHRLFSLPDIHELGKLGVLNINVPNIPLKQLRGVRVTTMGKRHYDQGFVPDNLDPELFWYGEVYPGHDGRPETDSTAMEQFHASISVLKPDFFSEEHTSTLRSALLPSLKGWPHGS